MKCPRCNANLNLAERQGVEIDYCPECRGIWLDRGELEKIIERSYDERHIPKEMHYDRGPFSDHHHDDHDRHHDKHYRKKSWLSELFD